MSKTEIRSLLVPISGGMALLPNATVAEVLDFSPPEPVAAAPDWMLGLLLWRGWHIPVISLAMLAGLAESEPVSGARLCIIKTLADNARMPYIGFLVQGFPRLTTVTEADLTEVPSDEYPTAVAARVIIGDREAFIPDLDCLARLTAEAAHYGQG